MIGCSSSSSKRRMQKTEAEKLFLDKMALLNKTFLHFIQCSLKEMPDADLSPTVRDYLKHVEELDRTYGEAVATVCNGDSASSTAETGNAKSGSESVSSASAKSSQSSEVSSTEAKSSRSSASLFSGKINSVTAPKIFFDVSESPSGENGKRGKKRAKRGGPEGDDEEVIISDHNTPTSTRHSANAEKETKGTERSQATPSPTPPIFSNNSATRTSFGIPDVSKTETEKKTNDKKSAVSVVGEADSSKSSLFSFGKKDDSEKIEATSEAPKFSFGETPSKDTEQTDKDVEEKEKVTDSTDKLAAAPIFSFLKPPITNEKSGSTTDGPVSVKSTSGFKFGPPPIVQPEQNNEGEEAEYVPPKPEIVMTEEPNAIFSTKCSVFVLKGKEYEKLGIGQLYIKKDETDEAKKILLVRAATTTGTVWVNSYVDDKLKHAKIDDVKLRVSCVSNGSPSTYLIRVPKKDDREKIEKEISHENSQ